MGRSKAAILDFSDADTFPKMLRRNYRKHGAGRTALRKKRYGVWRSHTWEDYYTHVRQFALGLLSLGFERGDKVAILGDNDPEWWYAALAAQSLGGVQYGIFVDCVPSEVQYFVEASDAVFVVAKDQEQCDKLLEIKDQIPKVRKVIYWEPKGMWMYDDSLLMDFQDVLALGIEYDRAHPDVFDEHVDRGDKEDIACFCFTSGTTGMPKAAMLSYRAFCGWTEKLFLYFPWSEGDDYFSFLCPAWGMDQWLGIGTSLMVAAVVNFPEKPDTIMADSREIAGHFQASGARAWEEQYRNLQVRLADADFIKRFFYRLFLPIGYRKSDLQNQNKEMAWWLKALYQVGDWLVFRPLRDKTGTTRARACAVAGAMMSPELFRYWRALGVPLYTNYGMTEIGLTVMESPGGMRVGSSGRVFPGRQLRISDDGEIMVAVDDQMFSGYYKRPEASAEKIRDGWFYTGDSGYMDEDGYLFFIDRLSELSTLAGGEKFSPTYIEASLRFSAYIRDVMVVGADREHVAALVDIDLGNCAKFAEKNRIVYTTRVDLSQKPEICELIRSEIEKVNKTAPEHSRVRKFVNLHKEFDPDEAEMTRTRKLKRGVLEEKYGTILEAIYAADQDSVEVQTEIRYRDGRTGSTATQLRIAKL
ncbi:MAG: AMP-binding protein [Proteobacteria bacterium]|nr:AMP-binding protein [Pseudomonadota bacterium]